MKVSFLYVLSAENLEQRAANRFNLCLSSLSKQHLDHGQELHVYIGDFSADSIRSELVIPKGIQIEYLHQPLEGPFSISFCYNYAYKQFNLGSQSFCFISDADLLYPINFIATFLKKHSCYDDKTCVTGLTFYQSRETEAYSDSYELANRAIRGEQQHRGGCMLISTNLFDLVHGYDEQFYSWGGEEDDFFRRASVDGTVIVDESVEFVSLSEPPKQVNEAVRRILTDLRKKNSSDQLQQPWGELQHQPKVAQRRVIQLQNNYLEREGHVIAEKVKDGYLLKNLVTDEVHKANEMGFEIWCACSGAVYLEEIVTSKALKYSVPSRDIRDSVVALVKQLQEKKLLKFSAHKTERPLVVLENHLDQSERCVTDYMLQTLSTSFSIILWQDEAEDQCSSHKDTPHLAPAAKILNHQGLGQWIQLYDPAKDKLYSIAYSSYESFHRDLEDYSFVITPRVSSTIAENAFRLPLWAPYFDWFKFRFAQQASLPAVSTISGPRTKPSLDKAFVVCFPLTDQPDPLADQLRTFFKPYGSIADYNPKEPLSVFKQASFVYVSEKQAKLGSASHLLPYALCADSIPIYQGDSLIDYDFNAKAMIVANLDGENSYSMIVDELTKLLESPAAFEKKSMQPKLNSDLMVNQLLPYLLARKIYQVFKHSQP